MRQNADFLAMLTIMTTKLAECEAECVELQDHINRDHTYMDEQARTINELRDQIDFNDRHMRRVREDDLRSLDYSRNRIATLEEEVRQVKEELLKLKYGGETPEERANAYMAKEGSRISRILNPKVGEGKIAAIKVVREITGWGLKDTKDFVEAYIQREDAQKDEEVGSGTKRSQQLVATGT